MKKLLVLLILIQSVALHAQQDVELVIATGFNYISSTCISHDNKMVAQGSKNNVSIWDISTGRQIRQLSYSNKEAANVDTLWFTDDNKTLVVKALSMGDIHYVDVETGNVRVEEKEIDWSNYKYKMNTFNKLNMELYQVNSKEYEFKGSDPKNSLLLSIITNNKLGNVKAFQIRLKKGNKTTDPLDTTTFAAFDFSDDGRYLTINNKVYDFKVMRVVSDFRITPYTGVGVTFMPGTRIPVSCTPNAIRIWDFPNVRDIAVENVYNLKPINDGKQVLVQQFDIYVDSVRFSIVDLEKQKIIHEVAIKKNKRYFVDAAVDGSMVSLAGVDVNYQTNKSKFTSYVLDIKTGKVKSFKDLLAIRFTPNKDVFIVDSAMGNKFQYNHVKGTLKPFPKEEIGVGTHTPGTSGNYELYTTASPSLKNPGTTNIAVWDSQTAEKITGFNVDHSSIFSVNFSQDNKLMAFYVIGSHAILVYDVATGKLKHRLIGHSDYVQGLRFSDDNKRLISGAHDGTCKLWNLETGKLMVTMVSTGENDFAIINPDQYYYSTKGAQKLIHFVRGINIYPFQQFDLKYNRPDIILESLEASNQDLIRPFNLAYQKRLKRLGFTEEMLDGEFHLPKISISNKEELPLFTDKREINLAVHGIDSKYKLDRLIIRINGVPIHGKLGRSLKDEDTQHFKDEVDVTLSRGSNRISVSVMNEKGVESITANANIEYHAKDDKLPKLYLVTLGVSKYANGDFNLNYAAKDAKDLANTFENQHLPFGEIVNIHLENEEVDIAALDEIKKTLNESSEDDVVCLFFAGHGLLDSELNYFLAAHDVNFQDPADGGIPYELFENLVDGIPARKKVMMIDACHSGEIDKDEVAWAEETSEVKEADEDLAFRSVTTTGLKQVGLNNSFELMKELFADIRRSSGTLIISSAGGTEYAMEGSDWNNGVFTYSLLNGIKSGKADLDNNGQVMVSEINQYVRKKVVELTNGRQSPTNRAEILDQDWRMW